MTLSSCCHGLKPEINKPVHIWNNRVRLCLNMYLYYCCDWSHHGIQHYCIALLCEWRLRRWSTLTAGMLMVNNGNAEWAGTVTTAAVEGLAKIWWYSVVVLPPASFVLEGASAGVFKRGDNIVGHETPSVTVLSQGGPLAMVNVTGTKGLFKRPLYQCLSVLPVKSSKYIMITGKKWFLILETCSVNCC